jgi:hypothetical protein
MLNRSRNITEEMLKKAVDEITSDITKEGKAQYFDDLDIGQNLLQDALGDNYNVKYHSGTDYAMWEITLQ